MTDDAPNTKNELVMSIYRAIKIDKKTYLKMIKFTFKSFYLAIAVLDPHLLEERSKKFRHKLRLDLIHLRISLV